MIGPKSVSRGRRLERHKLFYIRSATGYFNLGSAGRPVSPLISLCARGAQCCSRNAPYSRLMNANSKLRVAFVNTHPIQYFAPLYAYLNRTGEFAITALYLSDFSVRGSLDRAFGQAVKWDIDLLAGYDARFIKGAALRNEPAGMFSIVAPQIWCEVS